MLPAVIVMIRVWVRVGIKRSFGWDDSIVIVAVVGAVFPSRLLVSG